MIPGAKRVMMDVTASRTKEGEPACPNQRHTPSAKQAAYKIRYFAAV